MRATLLFAAWTLLVWGTRISNVLEDDGSAWAVAVAIAMIAGGAAVVITAVAGRGLRRAVVVLALATVAVWLVRLPGLLLDADHGTAFKLVHTALAVVSIALAATATAVVRAPRRARV